MISIRNVLTLSAFIISFFGTIVAGVTMIVEVLKPVTDGAHFSVAAITFFLLAVFFFFVRNAVED